MLRRTKSEVLKDLPAKLPAEIRFVTLSAKERKSYNEMRDDLVAQLDGGDVVGWNPLTQVTRLLQLASSNAEIQSSESEDDVKISLVEPSSKLDAMMDLLENDLQDEFVVIASVSRQLIELAEKRLEKAKISFGSVHGNVSTIQREKNVQDFQDGKLKTMLLTVGAGGEGITLHRAAVIVFLQRSWSLVQNKQTEDRIHRIGQEREVQIIDLVASDTIEEKVLERVVEKGERLEEVVRDKDRLRELL
jgi:SNF2 family DNA or RNA helicase